MKCTILETKINYHTLDYNINMVKEPEFLVMNQNTLYIMWKDLKPIEAWGFKGESYDTYKGIPIAICEKLKDGEVHIV